LPDEPPETAISTSDDEPSKAPSAEDVKISGDGLVHKGVLQLLAASYRGPLPPASELLRYDEVLPGLAERIIGSWESETLHRRSLEQQDASVAAKLLLRGQLLAASLATLFFGGSVYLMSTGSGVAGMAVVVAEIVALVAVFVIGRGRDAPRQAGRDSELPATEE